MKLAATLICAGLALLGKGFGVEVVTLGGYKVEANRVIAKRKTSKAWSAQDSSGFQVEHRSSLSAGLSILRKPSAELSALNDDAKRLALQTWIEELKSSGEFEYVEPSFVYQLDATPADARFLDGTLWALRNNGQEGGRAGADINVTGAWDYTTGSSNVIVALIDTGVRYTHRELAGQMWRNPGEIPGNGIDDDHDGYVDDVFGINAFEENGDPSDDDGHGTHIAGTIGAAVNDGYPHVGVAWKVRLMALRAGNSAGLPAAAVIKCIEYAAEHGAKIINASFGGYGFSRAQFDVISALRAKGVLFVTAAGNDHNDNDARPHYPSGFELDNVLSVAAIDRRGVLADFSNYGRRSVQVAAPGVDIFSTYFESDEAYAVLEGTSMAAPHVSGVAALIASYIPGASYSELKARILEGATRDAELKVSAGALNALQAITRGLDGVMEYSIVPANNSMIATGEAVPVAVSLTDGLGVPDAAVALEGEGFVLPLRYNGNEKSPGYGAYTNRFTPSRAGALAFRLIASAPGKTNLNEPVSFLAVSRPQNDRFADFIKVPSGASWSQVTSNRFATTDGPDEDRLEHGGVAGAASSIWYAWSVPVASWVLVDTAGSTFDTLIGVYRGPALDSLVPVAQANDAGARKAAWVKFFAEANVSYKIAIAGAPPNDEGIVRVRFAVNGEPDTTAPVVLITEPASGMTAAVRSVTVQGSAFDAGANASGIEEAGVQYTVSTNRVTNPGELPKSAQGTTNWVAPVDLEEGVNFITVWAFDYAQNRSREQQIVIYYQPEESANDLFVNARALPGAQGSVTNSNARASREPGEPAHAGNLGGRSLWYRFESRESGVLLLNTRGSTSGAAGQPLDTVLAIYASTNETPRVLGLEPLASNDDAGGASYSEAPVTVEANKAYYIAVDTYDGTPGTIQLNYAFRAGLIHQLTVLPPEGSGSVLPRSGPYPANAVVSLIAIPAPRTELDRFEVNGQPIRQNPATIVMSAETTVRAIFVPEQFAEDFQGAELREAFASTNWSIGTDPLNRFNRVLESSGGGLDEVTNITSLTVQTAGGLAGFDFGTSTEAVYDRLEFYITPMEAGRAANRFLLESWSGEVRDRYEFELPAGRVRLEWRYVKDGAISRGRDAVFIDNLSLPGPLIAPEMQVQQERAIVRLAGKPGQAYVLERSADLTAWGDREILRASASGELAVEEPVKGERRFYRITPLSSPR